MIRRRTTIPFFGWLGKRTREGHAFDRWIGRSLERSIRRLNDRQLNLLVAAHRPKAVERT